MKTQTIVLKSRPDGKPKESDFGFVEDTLKALSSGEILLKLQYVSVDPYLRGRMSDAKSYVEPFEIDKPMSSLVVAKVTDSKNDKFKKDDMVTGMLPWKKEQISNGENIQKIDDKDVPLSAYLGVLGMTGLTAYLGLTEIGKPKKGETLVVSGAAGAVGSTVGQIGKIMGCKVVGIAGTDEKVDKLKSKFGYNEGINYNTTDDMGAAIKKNCPDGVDIYFDNVGGEISDAILFNINKFSRTINCGAIAVYNETSTPKSVSVRPFLIKNSALMQGFIIGNYADKFGEARKQLAQYLKEDQLTYEETIVEGFENIPSAFMGLFEGKNTGKMIVKI
ncbi:NADP-dependent oxidoreductase [Sediminibacter sp. Hel_I_10]|uniref:NADP-dependent oxidoreductase n=1 Tax=Sediminibacter sp. Hel_I_10 TaxID=1392490 RepID=UPI000479BA0B|nr:NADP-dependent oxidoreductase [Sediminibacter sp. Hel_I_10]